MTYWIGELGMFTEHAKFVNPAGRQATSYTYVVFSRPAFENSSNSCLGSYSTYSLCCKFFWREVFSGTQCTELQLTHHPIEPDRSHAAVADKELVSSSVLSQHPDTSAAAADGVIHSVTGVVSGGEVAISGGGGGEGGLPVAAKRVLFVLAASSAALLVLAVSVGVVCRVQCKMQRSGDSCACAPPDGGGSGSIVIAGGGGVRNGRGPSESISTMGLLRSSNQGRHSCKRLKANSKLFKEREAAKRRPLTIDRDRPSLGVAVPEVSGSEHFTNPPCQALVSCHFLPFWPMFIISMAFLEMTCTISLSHVISFEFPMND